MRIERKILTRKQILLGRYSAQFWVLAAFLALVFLIGGGSRNDIQSLVILRPASILVFAFGLWTLSREHLNAYRWVFGMAAAIMILTALHLVPLPPAMWEALSGRGLLVEIDHAAGIGGVWRPLAMVPTGAWNAFFSLFAPLSVLVLGVQLDADERFRFLPLLLGIGLLSGSIGLLQILGAPDGPLYFYRVTNEGSAVGLFANRNHAAVFLACLFPLLAIFGWVNAETIERRRFRSWMSGILGGFILMLILVTGSRAGVVVAALGLVSVPLLYQPPQITLPARRKGAPRTKFTFIYGAFGIVALGVLTALFSRAEALKRLTAPDQLDDRRFQIWGPTLDAIWKY
ncbi:MAG: O-antigen polymerase, partial [Sphingomonadales bacterium]